MSYLAHTQTDKQIKSGKSITSLAKVSVIGPIESMRPHGQSSRT